MVIGIVKQALITGHVAPACLCADGRIRIFVYEDWFTETEFELYWKEKGGKINPDNETGYNVYKRYFREAEKELR